MPTATPSRVRELREALEQKAKDIQGMASSWKDETGNGHFVLSTEEKDRYQKTVQEATEIKDLLSTEEKAAGIFAFLGESTGPSVGGTDANAAHRSGIQTKSLGDSWLSSDSYREMKASGFRRLGDAFTLDQSLRSLSDAAQIKDIYSALGGNIAIPSIGQIQPLGWTERMLRPGRVRDLFPSETTQASLLYGVRETGFVNRAATVPERTAADGTTATGGATDVYGLKPKSDIQITPYSVGISTIAHIMYVHRQTLDDEPRLQGLLNRDLIDGVKMEEDSQLLYGDGIGENILGLTQTPGIQNYTGLNEKRSAQIRRGLTLAVLAYFQPTGVVIHPLDWEDLELETTTTGQYTIATSVAAGGEKRLWRLNVVDTPAMTAGHFLLGAFGLGAKVYDREQVRIDLSTENRDMFERNALTLRCEERIGLVVDRPESFVYGALTTPS